MDTWNALCHRWNGRGDGRIGLAMSPHATDTCGSDLLRACAARARELDVPITTHLAQSQAEVATIGRRYGGPTPAEHLDWLGLPAPHPPAAHCLPRTHRRLHLIAPTRAAGANYTRGVSRSGGDSGVSRLGQHG